jgi:hypothetical protein
MDVTVEGWYYVIIVYYKVHMKLLYLGHLQWPKIINKHQMKKLHVCIYSVYMIDWLMYIHTCSFFIWCLFIILGHWRWPRYNSFMWTL